VTITTKDFGALAGVVEEAPAVDTNAPVEQPRRCGLCAHFRRFEPAPGAIEPRIRRFGSCGARVDDQGFASAPVDRMVYLGDDLGEVVVGDLFGCVHFEARR